MRGIAAEEMADGALGIASALVYPPGSYAGTSELASLCEVAAAYDGCYASHVRARASSCTRPWTSSCGSSAGPGCAVRCSTSRPWGGRTGT
jgi:hypothetical protein